MKNKTANNLHNHTHTQYNLSTNSLTFIMIYFCVFSCPTIYFSAHTHCFVIECRRIRNIRQQNAGFEVNEKNSWAFTGNEQMILFCLISLNAMPPLVLHRFESKGNRLFELEKWKWGPNTDTHSVLCAIVFHVSNGVDRIEYHVSNWS